MTTHHAMSQTLERSTNGHAEPVRASDARLARIERRLKDVAESGEQRVSVLRDAIADLTAAELEQRDNEIALLKNQIAELTQKLHEKTTIDQLVNEAVLRLEARAVARDEAKRGPKGQRGERGARGERGLQGQRGPAGKPANPAPTIHSWHVDTIKFRVTPFLTDGTSLPHLELRPLFEMYFAQTNREEPS